MSAPAASRGSPPRKARAGGEQSAADGAKRRVVVDGFEKKAGVKRKVAEDLERGLHGVACPGGEPLADGSAAFKDYKTQYKRLCTHIRQNGSLATRLSSGELAGERLAAMSDEDLMAKEQRSELMQFRQEALQEALGIAAEDSGHWTPSDNYACPRCESEKCIYLQSFKGSHQYDDNNIEPVITIRCTACMHLWKEDDQEGGRLASGSLIVKDTEPPQAPPEPRARQQSEGATALLGQAREAAGSDGSGPAIWRAEGLHRSWLLPNASG